MNDLTQSEKEFLISLLQQELDSVTNEYSAANISHILVIIEKLKTL
jgi:hypothetical protein